jgi:hypothetical protein
MAGERLDPSGAQASSGDADPGEGQGLSAAGSHPEGGLAGGSKGGGDEQGVLGGHRPDGGTDTGSEGTEGARYLQETTREAQEQQG